MLHEWAASCWVMHRAAASPACIPPAFPKDRVLRVVIVVFIQPHVCQSTKPSLFLHSLQGDGNIRYYEIGSEKPYLSYLMEFRSPAPQKGLGKDGCAADPSL